ncbi:MAG: PIG-L family deacetylase, partial [Candidatus Binatia bacterium]
LGFEDSGLDAAKAGCFASIPLEDVAARLADIFRAERPDAVLTYDRSYARGHPDHVRCLDAAIAAGGSIPLFGTRTYSPARLRAMHDWLVARGEESPYARMLERVRDDATPFERVEVGSYIEVARRALLAHRSQISPSDRYWFSVPTEALREIYPWEDFTT